MEKLSGIKSTTQDVIYKSTVILPYLKVGKKNAISMDELQILTGYSRRVITRSMQYLREIGYPVCSNGEPKGYFLGCADDIAEYLHRLSVCIEGYKKTYDTMFNILRTLTH